MQKTIASLAVVFLLAGCTEQLRRVGVDDDTLRAGVQVIKATTKKETTPEEEAQIGHESASMLLGAAPLIQDAELMQYLNALGAWIASQSGRSDINWRFGIINSSNVNAFAAPDGYVFVTKGLLRQLHNEAELAGVVAHEIAHVVKRHYIAAIRKKDTTGALSTLGASAAKAAGVRGSEYAATPLFNLAQNMYSSGLDKGDEYEADRLGVTYATRAGYDPYGLPRVLSMYAANHGAPGYDLLFSTHPSPQDRLDELGKAMSDKLAAFEKTGLADSKVFVRMVARAKGIPDPAR